MKRTEHVSATVAAVIGLLVLCGSPIHAADSAKPVTPFAITKTRNIKAVYQIKTDDWKKGVGSGLYYVEKLANAYTGMGLADEAFQISAVLHGEAGYWLLKDDVYRKETGKSEDNPNKAIIQRLLDLNISIELCAQTMKSHGWKADDGQAAEYDFGR